MSIERKNIVVGITGASGAIYAQKLIFRLQQLNCSNVGVIFTDEGKKVFEHELGNENISEIPYKVYSNSNFFAGFASGSSPADAFIVIPCSMGTMARIANGTSDNLICRTADVVLKERKKLLLVVRESPYNLIHLKNMEKITMAGGIICPATPSFYSKPKSIDELVDTIINRVIDIALGDNLDGVYRWGE